MSATARVAQRRTATTDRRGEGRPATEPSWMSMVCDAHPTVFCAWCRRVIRWGGDGVSHGICARCEPAVLAEIEARLADPEPGSPGPSREPGTAD